MRTELRTYFVFLGAVVLGFLIGRGIEFPRDLLLLLGAICLGYAVILVSELAQMTQGSRRAQPETARIAAHHGSRISTPSRPRPALRRSATVR